MTETPPSTTSDSLKTLTLVIHGLNLATMLLGVSGLVAIVLAYVKRSDVAGTIWESHFTFFIRTFWVTLAVGVVSLPLIFLGIGLLTMMAVGVWWLVRSIFALLKALEDKPVPNPESWLI